MFLGNDLVHWGGEAAREKESLSVPVTRFFNRVLQDSEQLVLEALGTVRNGLSTIPLPRYKALWAFWAAKEAVFKAAVKANPALRFSPKSIAVEISRMNVPWGSTPSGLPGREGTDRSRLLARGWARVQDAYYEILWEYRSDYVHALAVGPRDEPSIGVSDPFHHRVMRYVERQDLVAPAVLDCVVRASRSVRVLAQELARLIPGIGDRAMDWEIRREMLPGGRLGPPIFFGRDTPVGVDLSLSHDGPWAAVALLPETSCRPEPYVLS